MPQRHTTRHRSPAYASSVCAIFTLAPAMLGALPSCSSPPRGSLDSPVPQERILAAAKAAELGNRDAVPSLVRFLASDDPLVRMIAQRSLEDITGQSLGYHHADPEPRREQAIARWQHWLAQSPLAPDPQASAAAHAEPPPEPIPSPPQPAAQPPAQPDPHANDHHTVPDARAPAVTPPTYER